MRRLLVFAFALAAVSFAASAGAAPTPVPPGPQAGDLYTVNADGTDLTRVTHDGDVEKADWGTRPLPHN